MRTERLLELPVGINHWIREQVLGSSSFHFSVSTHLSLLNVVDNGKGRQRREEGEEKGQGDGHSFSDRWILYKRLRRKEAGKLGAFDIAQDGDWSTEHASLLVSLENDDIVTLLMGHGEISSIL